MRELVFTSENNLLLITYRILKRKWLFLTANVPSTWNPFLLQYIAARYTVYLQGITFKLCCFSKSQFWKFKLLFIYLFLLFYFLFFSFFASFIYSLFSSLYSMGCRCFFEVRYCHAFNIKIFDISLNHIHEINFCPQTSSYMFKADNKNTSTTPIASFWCLYC